MKTSIKTPKTYTIKTSRSGRGSRDYENTKTGTLEELIEYHKYTLEIGHSWNRKISMEPKTIKSLAKNLQMSYEEQEASCYSRTTVYLV